MPRDAAQDEQIREHVDDVDRFEPTRHANGQALVGELVDDIEQPDFAPIMGALLDEVIGPDMVRTLGAQPNARSVREPQTSALGLPGGDLQPLASPDPLDPLVVDQPAGATQQLGNLAIAVAAILPCQLDNIGRQSFLVITAPRDLALRRAMLTERRTGTALGYRQHMANMLDAGAASRGAQ
jgi:hypothetical protein